MGINRSVCFQIIHDWTVKYEVEAPTTHPGPENAFTDAIVPLNFRRIYLGENRGEQCMKDTIISRAPFYN